MFIAQSPSFRDVLASHGIDPNMCWKLGFAVPAIGMVLGIVQYFAGYKKLGNVLLALPTNSLFYTGLALAALGTGLLKQNVSTIVGQLYSANDPRRESGFTIYYMGINIGAFGAPLVCGFIAESPAFRDFLTSHGISAIYSWKFAFAAVAVGMGAGLVQYVLGVRRLGDAGAKPTIPSDPRAAARDRTVLGAIIGVLVLIAGLVVAFQDSITESLISNVFPVILAVISIGLFYGLYKNGRDSGERKRVIAMIPLFIGAIAFFGIFEQASSTLNLFAERNTTASLFGFMEPSYYQSVNSVFIIALAPVFAWLWVSLGKKGKEPSSVTKFGIGMLLIAVAFVIMLPTLPTVKSDGRVSGMYLVLLYFFYTCSELCISPVGLSSMSRLAPPRLAGMVMGTWFLAASIGNFIAGQAAGFSATRGLPFLVYTVIILALIVGAALFAIAPVIRRMLASEGSSRPPADKSEKAEPEPLPTARTIED
jgi:POT family proton-dependent oligopeptide transporter